MRAWIVCVAALVAGCGAPEQTVGDGDGQRVEGDGEAALCVPVGSWSDPDVYAALAGREGVVERNPDDLLASAPGDPGARITYFGVRHDDGVSFFLTSNATRISIAGMLPPDAEREDVRERFTSFARRMTPADEARVDAWFEAFWASREPGLLSHDGQQERVEAESAQVVVDAPLRIEEVWQELGPPEPGEQSVQWTTENGTWEARWEYATRTLRIETDERPLLLRAQERGRVFAWSDEEVPEQDAQPWLAASLADAGLPLPEFRDWRVDTAVC